MDFPPLRVSDDCSISCVLSRVVDQRVRCRVDLHHVHDRFGRLVRLIAIHACVTESFNRLGMDSLYVVGLWCTVLASSTASDKVSLLSTILVATRTVFKSAECRWSRHGSSVSRTLTMATESDSLVHGVHVVPLRTHVYQHFTMRSRGLLQLRKCNSAGQSRCSAFFLGEVFLRKIFALSPSNTCSVRTLQTVMSVLYRVKMVDSLVCA